MKICLIGSGYVGLVTGACFSDVGHQVICVDNNATKVQQLQAGHIPIYEPGLEALVKKNVAEGRLRFTVSIEDGVDQSQVIFIAVPTPPQPDGSVDLRFIEGVAREIAAVMKSYKIVVDKSTVPVQTGEKVAETISRYNKAKVDFDVVSNPEFLREGSAIGDLMNPDRIVIGVNNERPVAAMKEVYEPFKAPIIVTDINSAELIKHAANSFLALKISYINALSIICEMAGADVEQVADGMGADKRIGRQFLNAGLGYGGSCFPKDLSAFIHIADELGYEFDLLKEVEKINCLQKERFIKKIRETLWILTDKKIGVLGLSFKPNTDDIRSSAAIEVVQALIKEGAKISVYDPKAMAKTREILPNLNYCENPYDVADGSEALIILTEWDEFRSLDIGRIKNLMVNPIILDGRNIFSPKVMESAGFIYKSIGR
ncbi:MAG: UDP-glucose/GDP-mannose dehydrogenase family protein [Verrucomicrobiota bacterium]|nr:UDP-glucose/GDP-mannose dehydrogenase family protein [Verrucomicrobiota bacterium]